MTKDEKEIRVDIKTQEDTENNRALEAIFSDNNMVLFLLWIHRLHITD
jgi:hypothetical protein